MVAAVLVLCHVGVYHERSDDAGRRALSDASRSLEVGVYASMFQRRLDEVVAYILACIAGLAYTRVLPALPINIPSPPFLSPFPALSASATLSTMRS